MFLSLLESCHKCRAQLKSVQSTPATKIGSKASPMSSQIQIGVATETNLYDVSSSMGTCGGKADWLPTALRKGIRKSISLRQTGQYENNNPNRESSNAGDFVVE